MERNLEAHYLTTADVGRRLGIQGEPSVTTASSSGKGATPSPRGERGVALAPGGGGGGPGSPCSGQGSERADL